MPVIKKSIDREVIIYFIQAKSSPVKIGYTENKLLLNSRLQMIQTHNHEKVTLIRTLVGTVLTEKWLHTRYKKNHIHGEWFEFNNDMLTIIPPSYFNFLEQQLLNNKRLQLHDLSYRLLIIYKNIINQNNEIVKSSKIRKIKIKKSDKKVIDEDGREWILNF